MKLPCNPFRKVKNTYKIPPTPSHKNRFPSPQHSDDSESSSSENEAKEKPTRPKLIGVHGGTVPYSGESAKDIQTPRFSKDLQAKNLIKDAIANNEFLRNLEEPQVVAIVEAMYLREVQANKYVIAEGEVGSHLFVSAQGLFQVIKKGRVLSQFGPGKAFGEIAILYNSPRQASIKVLEDAILWVLDRKVFQQIMMRTGLLKMEENIKFLKSVPLLKELDNSELTKMCDLLQVEFFAPDTVIVKQGEQGDKFYIISGGSVSVTKRKPGTNTEEKLVVLGKSDYFGEQALLTADKRQATVTALHPGAECLVLSREPFVRLLGNLKELRAKNWDKDIERRPSRNIEYEIEHTDVALEDLKSIATLGVGGFGRVELVQNAKNKGLIFALKGLPKKAIVQQQQQQHVYNEKQVMFWCKGSRFIARLYRTYKTSSHIYFLLEPCLGGDLFGYLQKYKIFEEKMARFFLGCAVEALEYLHVHDFIYRDLKPENLMFDAKGYLKLVDFGFAKRIGPRGKTWTFAGTPEYIAPEIILSKGHDKAVDYWALGILMHELLAGRPPFRGKDNLKTYNLILLGIDHIDMPRIVSKNAQQMIRQLCKHMPTERLGYQKAGIFEIKQHRWFQSFEWKALANGTMKAPLLPKIKHSLDISNFEKYDPDIEEASDEESGWDNDF